MKVNPAHNTAVSYEIVGDSFMILSSNNTIPIELKETAAGSDIPNTIQFDDDPTIYPLLFNTVYRHPFNKRVTIQNPYFDDGITKFLLCYGENRTFPLVSLKREPLWYHYSYNGLLHINASGTTYLYPQVWDNPIPDWYYPIRTANMSLNLLANPNMTTRYHALVDDNTNLGATFLNGFNGGAVASVSERQGIVLMGHRLGMITITNNVAVAADVYVSVMGEIG
jgi:hypothetical protein